MPIFKIFILLIFLLFCSCVAQKQKYITRKIHIIEKTYKLTGYMEKDSAALPNKKYRYITKKMIDTFLLEWEKEWALFPDSMQGHGMIKETETGFELIDTGTDSFYTNKSKQQFILKYNLKTKGMIFLPQK